MTNVRHILQEKGGQIWWVSPETIVFDALQLMAEKNVGALVVMVEENLVGIFSERDYARKIILQGRKSRETTVSEIMSTEVTSVHPSQSVDDCMSLMTDKRIRHLPVLDQEKLLGVISIGDVVKAVISEREFTIKQLENYITGGQ